MSLILHIDTATDKASISLAFEGKVLQERLNGFSMDHAAWIHAAIKEMMQDYKDVYSINDIKAVAVVGGPGSYTGLRVGMATAKGFCFALNIPLISLNTLKLLAYATANDVLLPVLVCPMLDARRMEVFTALYDANLQELIPPCAMILDQHSFEDWLTKFNIVFSGSGSIKWKDLVHHENARFKDVFYTPQHMAVVAYQSFVKNAYLDIAYAEPAYLKDFYSSQKN